MDSRFPNRKPAAWFFKQELGMNQDEFTDANVPKDESQEESGTVSEKYASPAYKESGGFVVEPQGNLPSETDEDDGELPSYVDESSPLFGRFSALPKDAESDERSTDSRSSSSRRLFSDFLDARQTDEYFSSFRCGSMRTYSRVSQFTSVCRETSRGQTSQTAHTAEASTMKGAGFDTWGNQVSRPYFNYSPLSSDDDA
ncbi:uncharacterized protein [Palaemon carinicauda]|uniref:uncharacterized protein n=1 Tax=Palaemon carinicauda TaxID=392227 RepID=UPI0035B586BE